MVRKGIIIKRDGLTCDSFICTLEKGRKEIIRELLYEKGLVPECKPKDGWVDFFDKYYNLISMDDIELVIDTDDCTIKILMCYKII